MISLRLAYFKIRTWDQLSICHSNWSFFWGSPIKNTYVTQFLTRISFNRTSDFGFQSGLFFYKYLLSTVLLQIYFKSTVLLLHFLTLSLLSLPLFLALLSLPFMSQRHIGYLAPFSVFQQGFFHFSVAWSLFSHTRTNTLFAHISALSLSLSISLFDTDSGGFSRWTLLHRPPSVLSFWAITYWQG